MAATATPTSSDTRAHLFKIVNDSRTAFMVTRGEGDSLHGRPMATAKVEENATVIYFASHRSSPKVEELKSDSHVYLGYSNSTGSEWASINGRGRIVDNRSKIRELWSPIWKNWFEGPDDPNLILIEVTPESGEYWDSGSKALAMVKFAITAVTGKRMSDGEHAEVKL